MSSVVKICQLTREVSGKNVAVVNKTMPVSVLTLTFDQRSNLPHKKITYPCGLAKAKECTEAA